MFRVAATLGLISIAGLSIAALVSGSDFLVSNLAFGVPAGNAIAVCGLVSLGLLATMICQGLLVTLSRVALTMAFVWYPLSALIAGNLRLNFQGDESRWWLLITAVTLVLLLAALLLGGYQQVYRRLRRHVS